MTNPDLVDDITGDIDDIDLDRAIAMITANLAELDELAAENILDATKVAGARRRRRSAPRWTRRKHRLPPSLPGSLPPRAKLRRRRPGQEGVRAEGTDSGRLDHTACGHEHDGWPVQVPRGPRGHLGAVLTTPPTIDCPASAGLRRFWETS